MNERKKLIHQVRDFFKMRRDMIAYVNRFLAESTAKLRNIGDSSVVQGPQSVFVECLNPFPKANFNAV